MSTVAPPARNDISGTAPNPSNAVARAGFGQLWDFVTNLLGTVGSPATARAALGSTAVGDALFVATTTAVGRAAIGAELEAGALMPYARNTAPSGWLKANGALVSRTTYATLFAAIGTTFGVGDGSTTFALPDLRGEFVRGWDDGRGIDTSRAFGSAQTDAFKTHTHNWLYNIATAGASGGAVNVITGGPSAANDSTGGTETRPRNIAALICIKY